jgi:2-polyprenyl-6-methoxyphenol hydroxylase-like FAD-dependent oxidoreductase
MEPVSATTAGEPRIIIVGGGFGGLAAARALRKASARVLLIDKTNHHVPDFAVMKERGERIVMLTAYDATMVNVEHRR